MPGSSWSSRPSTSPTCTRWRRPSPAAASPPSASTTEFNPIELGTHLVALATKCVPSSQDCGASVGPADGGVAGPGDGEDLDAVVGDDDGVLELGAREAVGGHLGPAVVPLAQAGRAGGEHRL